MAKESILMLIAISAVVLMGLPASGGTISIDENGNGIGTVGPGFLGNDPGPGGLNGVLIYQLPFAGVQGDVGLLDNGIPLDYVRFNGNGTVIFYSDNVDGFDAIGDTPAPPGQLYQNLVRLEELGPEGNNGAIYTPLPGQPGYDPNALPTYNLISDGSAVPEPSSVIQLALGLGALGLAGFNRKRA